MLSVSCVTFKTMLSPGAKISIVIAVLFVPILADFTDFSNPTRNGNEVTFPSCSFPDGIYYQNGPEPNLLVAPINQNYTLTINGSTEGRYTCGSSAFGGGITLLRKSQAGVMHTIIFHNLFRSI